MTYQNLNEKVTYAVNENKIGFQHSSGQSGGYISNLGLELRENLVENIDLTTVNANCEGYVGCCFDGRYMYLNGYDATPMIKYDTTASYSDTGSYEIFSLTSINANYKGFVSSCFDGRYVYYISFHNGSGYVGYVARYDTLADFTNSGSWSVIDLTSENADWVGYFGATIKDNYLYLTPLLNGNSKSNILRYDLTTTFTAANFTNFDLTTISSNYVGYLGCCHDERYVYFAPWANGGTPHGYLVRYDTTQSFTSSGSYTIINLTAINANYKGYADVCFDGRYVYVVPRYGGGSVRHGYLVIYDTLDEFTSGNMNIINLTAINANYKGFESATFDGRYVYLIPYDLDGTFKHGNVVRLDPLNNFSTSSVATDNVNANWEGYNGGMILNKYLYLIPASNTLGLHGNFTRIRIKP